jgi:flagellar FliJ protein
MKKFTFRYAKILQVRIDKENEIRNNLGKINKVILEKENELKIVTTKYELYLNELNDSFQKGVFVRDMQAVSAGKEYLVKKIDTVRHDVTVLIEERHNIQRQLIEANKQRKIMEKLKENEIENYRVLEAMEEAKTVDQIVTYQSTNKKGE